MQLIQSPQREELSVCPYLEGRSKRYAYFLAGKVDDVELSRLLEQGWRKFGPYYFRPECPACRECIPLRVSVQDFTPSRSQRRILRQNNHLEVRFSPLRPSERIYQIYRSHSLERFGQDTDREEFLFHFYMPSCPGLQSEIYLGGQLVGVGILDRGVDCLNSVYFSFDPRFSALNLGTYGALAEIEEARRLGLPWYYLGYYVPGCRRMNYKDAFRPRQHFSWAKGAWGDADG